MEASKITPEPMSKTERLKKNLLWLVQGFLTGCFILGCAFGGFAAYGSLFAATSDPIQYAAEFMFSGFVILILFAATIIPAILSSLTSEAGVLRALGAALGLITIMGMISELVPPG